MRRWICYLLAPLRIHSPDCEHCGAHEMCWGEMRERIEELNRLGTPTERVASFRWAIVVIRPGRLWLARNLFTEGNRILHEN
jgi:hypothetical protein